MPIPSDGILELERFLDINVKAILDMIIGWILEGEVEAGFERDFDVMRGFLGSEFAVNLMPGKLRFWNLLLCHNGDETQAKSIWN
jgi:hypothetical protein